VNSKVHWSIVVSLLLALSGQAADRGVLAETQSQLNELREAVSDLNGQIEQQQRAIEQLRQQLQQSDVRPVAGQNDAKNMAEAVDREGSYQAAQAVMRAGQYEQAAKLWRELIASSAEDDPAALMARYWLAEIAMMQGDKAEARRQYLQLLQQQTGVVKQPEAMLKLAQLAADDGAEEEAAQWLADLQVRFPQSSAAQMAKSLAK